jgi:hypothetical protein
MAMTTAIDYSKIDQQRRYLVEYKIGEMKNAMYGYIAKEYDVEKGVRFRDNSSICTRLLTNIYQELGEATTEEVNAKFLSLNSLQIRQYIYEAVRDAATADYYYMYEKEW